MRDETPLCLILFDGECNLCNGFVNFIIRYDKKKSFKFSPLQSAYSKSVLKQHKLNKLALNTVVYVENNDVYLYSSAALYILKKLNFPFSIAIVFLIIPSFIRDRIYFFVAKNRYKWFKKKTICRIGTSANVDRFL